MPRILCIETATEKCSVAIAVDKKIISLMESKEDYQHTMILTDLINQATQEAGIKLDAIDAVAVSEGPGSYTALRVGISTAKGICYALKKPLIAISTLQALAWAALKQTRKQALYAPMIDARRMEVYTAMYNSLNIRTSNFQPIIVENNTFDSYFAANTPIVFCGNGAPKCQPIINHPLAYFINITCSAAHLVEIAESYYVSNLFKDLNSFSPFYLKKPNITTPKKKL